MLVNASKSGILTVMLDKSLKVRSAGPSVSTGRYSEHHLRSLGTVNVILKKKETKLTKYLHNIKDLHALLQLKNNGSVYRFISYYKLIIDWILRVCRDYRII